MKTPFVIFLCALLIGCGKPEEKPEEKPVEPRVGAKPDSVLVETSLWTDTTWDVKQVVVIGNTPYLIKTGVVRKRKIKTTYRATYDGAYIYPQQDIIVVKEGITVKIPIEESP